MDLPARNCASSSVKLLTRATIPLIIHRHHLTENLVYFRLVDIRWATRWGGGERRHYASGRARDIWATTIPRITRRRSY